jgi:hypothetical protein
LSYEVAASGLRLGITEMNDTFVPFRSL